MEIYLMALVRHTMGLSGICKLLNMNKIFTQNFVAYSFSNILAPHLITTKPYDMHKKSGAKYRRKVAAFLALREEYLVFPGQEHTSNVGVVTYENLHDSFYAKDALITNAPGVALGVVTADCVPILLYDLKKKAVAAVHAGWRGTNSRVVEKTIIALQEKFGTNVNDLVAGIGPSISPEVYEVDEDVLNAFKKSGHNTDLFFKPKSNGKFLLDLWSANYTQLTNMGLSAGSIEQSKMCTFTLEKEFYSARREGIGTGRIAAVIKNDY